MPKQSMMDHRNRSEPAMDDIEPTPDSTRELPLSKEPEVVIDSVTLTRLLEEVRNGSSLAPGAYNRVHNRHNR
jgi:hypothetical protein